MNPERLKRIGVWLTATVFSFGLSVVFIGGIIVLSPVFGASQGRGLFGAGLGLFTVTVIWPGLLTFCLILFDGAFLDTISARLFIRSSAWGLALSVGYYFLLDPAINIIGLANTFGGRGVGTIFSLAVFACPSLLFAYAGIRTRAIT